MSTKGGRAGTAANMRVTTETISRKCMRGSEAGLSVGYGEEE